MCLRYVGPAAAVQCCSIDPEDDGHRALDRSTRSRQHGHPHRLSFGCRTCDHLQRPRLMWTSSFLLSVLRPAGGRDADLSGARRVRGRSCTLVSGQPLIGVAQVIIDQLNSSTLMALPLFVMAAAFMRQGGVAKRPGRCRDRLARRHPRLARPGHRGRLHAVRGDLRLVGRDGPGDGDDPAAGDDRARLSPLISRSAWSARPAPSASWSPSLALILYGIVARAVGAAAVPGRHPARAVAGGGVLRLGLVLRPRLQPAARALHAVRRALRVTWHAHAGAGGAPSSCWSASMAGW